MIRTAAVLAAVGHTCERDREWWYLAWYTDKCSEVHASSTITTDTAHRVTVSRSTAVFVTDHSVHYHLHYVLIHRRPHQQVHHIRLAAAAAAAVSAACLPLTGTALQSQAAATHHNIRTPTASKRPLQYHRQSLFSLTTLNILS